MNALLVSLPQTAALVAVSGGAPLVAVVLIGLGVLAASALVVLAVDAWGHAWRVVDRVGPIVTYRCSRCRKEKIRVR